MAKGTEPGNRRSRGDRDDRSTRQTRSDRGRGGDLYFLEDEELDLGEGVIVGPDDERDEIPVHYEDPQREIRAAEERRARSEGRTRAGRSDRAGREPRSDYEPRSSRTSSGSRRRSKSHVGHYIVQIVLILVLGAAIAVFAKRQHDIRYGYSDEQADFAAYSAASPSRTTVYFGNRKSDDVTAYYLEGQDYLPIETVKSYFSPHFYSNLSDGEVLYCTDREIFVAPIEGQEYHTVSGQQFPRDYIPARVIGTEICLSMEFVSELTGLKIESFREPSRMRISRASYTDRVVRMEEAADLRVEQDRRSPYLKSLEEGQELVVLETFKDWSRVMTDDLVYGYIENRYLSEPWDRTTEVAERRDEYVGNPFPGQVSMVWHNVAGTAGNDTFWSYTEKMRNVNVIAPTWYPVSDTEGNLESYASADYVTWAKEAGLEVWPVVDNFNLLEGDYGAPVNTRAKRTRIIDRLMQDAEQYGYDGINVDFEHLPPESGEDFIQFVRELSVACRSRGLTLSVDNYVTYDYNDYYHMDEQAVYCDYVVIMGYDEHYSGSQEAGSVASIGYVSYGIDRALEEVPAAKLINGVPFYTRLWELRDGTLTSQALGMAQANEFVANHGLTPQWQEETCQNYIHSEENGVTYDMWLEDAESLGAKLSVMQNRGLAGVAAWKLGFETEDIWELIGAYLQGESTVY